MTNNKETKKKRGATQRSYPNKVYKIYPFYIRLFNSIMDITNRSNLTESLLQEQFKHIEIKKIPKCTRYELFHFMIYQLVKSKKSVKLLLEIFNHDRIQKLKEIYTRYGYNDLETVRDSINFRIDNQLIKEIKSFSQNLDYIGEVIELAIALYITEIHEDIYTLIRFSFEQNINKEKELN